MKATILIPLALCLLAPHIVLAEETAPSSQDSLKRVYALRMRLEQERLSADNEARANVRLVSQSGPYGADNPTVSQLRQETSTQLARFEQSLRCLDVDVQNNGGNTVVICGGNSGAIESSNTAAGGDLVLAPGGGR